MTEDLETKVNENIVTEVIKRVENEKPGADYFRPESLAVGNIAGGVIAGIGTAFSQTLGFPNGWTMLGAAALFGIIAASSTRGRGTSKLMLVVYFLLATGVGMWDAVQSGTFLDVNKVTVSAKEPPGVTRSEFGEYVAWSEDCGEHRVPECAYKMYLKYAERKAGKDDGRWRVKFK